MGRPPSNPERLRRVVQEVLRDAPVGFWPMWESTAAATQLIDQSGSGRHGTVNASGVTPSAGGPLPGAQVASKAFDGVTSGGAINLDLSPYHAVTCCYWLYWPAFANDDAMSLEFTASGYATTGGFAITPNSNSIAPGSWLVVATAASGNITASFARPAPGWHHVAVVIDWTAATFTGVTTLYLDGVPQVDLTPNGVANTQQATLLANSTLYVMSRTANSLRGTGRMALLSVHPAALSPSRVAAQYGAAIRPPQRFAAFPSDATNSLPATAKWRGGRLGQLARQLPRQVR